MDTPFDAALAALRQQRDRLSGELRGVTRLIAELEVHAKTAERATLTVLPAPTPLESAPELRITVRPDELMLMSYPQAARTVLKRAKRPLPTRTLLDLLTVGGKGVRGRDPYRILYRTLMKHSAFKNVDKKWALVEWNNRSEDDLLTGT